MSDISVISRDITDDEGNLLDSAQVTIRLGHAEGGALASLFSDQAGTVPLGNPVTLDGLNAGSPAPGRLQAYAARNRYRLEGTDVAGTGFALIDTTAGDVPVAQLPPFQPFANRAAAMAYEVATGVTRIGWYTGVFGLASVVPVWVTRDADGVIVSDDGTKWSPEDDPYPDHYVQNAVPGTTDMSGGVEAALARSSATTSRAMLAGGTYLVTRNIRTYARNGVVLQGQGIYKSKILVQDGDYSVFTFFTGQTGTITRFPGTPQERTLTVPLSCLGVEMYDFEIDTVGVGMTGGWFIEFEERCGNGIFDRIKLDNSYNGMDLKAASYTNLGVVYMEATRRALRGGTMLRFTSDEAAGVYDPDDISFGARCTDVKCDALQLNSNGPLVNPYDVCVYIGSADGIYFGPGCHLRGGVDTVVMETALSPNRTVIASVDLIGVYFDGAPGEGGPSGIGAHITFKGHGNGELWTPEGGTEGAVKFRSITSNASRYRNATSAVGAIRTDMTAGAVDLFSIRGGQIRDCVYSAIRDANAVAGFKNMTIEGVQFSGNNTVGSATHGDIYVRDEGHHITGNEFLAGNGGTDVGYNIRLLAGVLGESAVKGNYLVGSSVTAPSRRISYTAGAYVSGNAGYKQDARGEATITNPSSNVIVTHGMAETPTSVQVTPRTDGSGVTRFWVDMIGSTTFRLSTNAAPTTSMAFAWQATSGIRT